MPGKTVHTTIICAAIYFTGELAVAYLKLRKVRKNSRTFLRLQKDV
jgi:hypothetical protein